MMQAYELHQGYDFTGMVEAEDGGFYSRNEVDKFVIGLEKENDQLREDLKEVVGDSCDRWRFCKECGRVYNEGQGCEHHDES